MNIRKTIKRCLTMCLSLTLVLAAVMPPGLAAEVPAYTISQEGLDLIKGYEGFLSTPYLDGGYWYIGYGTQCDPADYPNAISEEEGEALLRRALVNKEAAVNQLLATNHITVTQQQFDVLVDMTYNFGTNWMYTGCRVYDYLLAGMDQYTEQQVINAFGTWCHSGGKVLPGLVDRRLRTAWLYLYGEYDNDAASIYTYVEFNAAGGEILPSSIWFYPVGSAYGELPVPTREGYNFLGWYNADGVRLEEEAIAGEHIAVTARWKDAADYSDWVNPYTDVKETSWYFDYVRELSAKGIVSGYPDDTFRASNALKTSEALKLILLAAGHPDPGEPTDGRHWATLYLELAEELGCVAPGEITSLGAPIDRQTIARIAAIAMGLEPRDGLSPFADVEEDGYIRTLFEEGIFEGDQSGGKRYFYPEKSIKRSEICAVIVRISNWERQEKNDPAQSGYIQYLEKEIPVLPNVPVSRYDKYLFERSGSTMYYNDPSYTTAIGVDVSSWQGEIDWEQVAGAGVQFAMLRIGLRGNSAGKISLDTRFLDNLAGAKAAGLDVGVYFFSQAISVEEAREEAAFVLESLDGAELEYPVVFDWEVEHGWRTYNTIDRDTLTDCAILFCETMEEAGYTPMIYVGLHVAYNKLDLSRLTDYDLWFAQYIASNRPAMYYDYRIWQYTSSGSVPGIKGNVDMSIALRPY